MQNETKLTNIISLKWLFIFYSDIYQILSIESLTCLYREAMELQHFLPMSLHYMSGQAGCVHNIGIPLITENFVNFCYTYTVLEWLTPGGGGTLAQTSKELGEPTKQCMPKNKFQCKGCIEYMQPLPKFFSVMQNVL